MASIMNTDTLQATFKGGAHFRFLDLPVEIRRIVYSFCDLLETDDASLLPLEACHGDSIVTGMLPLRKLPAIVATCRIIRSEAIKFIFNNSDFLFALEDIYDGEGAFESGDPPEESFRRHSFDWYMDGFMHDWLKRQDDLAIESIHALKFWVFSPQIFRALEVWHDDLFCIDVRNNTVRVSRGANMIYPRQSRGHCDRRKFEQWLLIVRTGLEALLDGLQLRDGIRCLNKATLSDMMDLVKLSRG